MRSTLRLLLGTEYFPEDRDAQGVLIYDSLSALLARYHDARSNQDRAPILSLIKQKIAARHVLGMFANQDLLRHEAIKIDPGATKHPVQIVLNDISMVGAEFVPDARVLAIGDMIVRMVLTLRDLPVGDVEPGMYTVDIKDLPGPTRLGLDGQPIEAVVEVAVARQGDRRLTATITTVAGTDEATFYYLFTVIARWMVGIRPALEHEKLVREGVPRPLEQYAIAIHGLVVDPSHPPTVTLTIPAVHWNGEGSPPGCVVLVHKPDSKDPDDAMPVPAIVRSTATPHVSPDAPTNPGGSGTGATS